MTLGLGTEIAQVHKGYPADKVGLLAGDVLTAVEEIRGEPGTQLVLLVVRGSKKFEVTLTREKICYD